VADLSIYFNPRCSKCRTARGLLEERGITVRIVEYLDQAPTVSELRVLMGQLGLDDPRLMMRTGEELYGTLGLADQSGDELLEAMAAHPILLERPIVVRQGHAVIARPTRAALGAPRRRRRAGPDYSMTANCDRSLSCTHSSVDACVEARITGGAMPASNASCHRLAHRHH
jgi:arsenate reductase